MTVFVALMLIVVVFVVVAYPLFRQKTHAADAAADDDDKLRELYFKRDTTYSMLKELDFDLKAGILTEEDFAELERRYKGKAISILRGIDDSKKDINVEDEIEKRILGLRQVTRRFCSQCGVESQQDDRFCSSCGTNLKRGEAVD